MGRIGKPTRQRILEGDQISRINFDEPHSAPGLGDPPSHLAGYALDAWEQCRVILDEMKIGKRSDRLAITIFCENYRRWRECLDVVEKGRPIEIEEDETWNDREERFVAGGKKTVMVDQGYVKEKIGTVSESQFLKIAERAEATMLSILRQYGMTAVSRAQLKVVEGEDGAELALFTLGATKKKA